MRIWDCDPAELTNKHLAAEHLEIRFGWSGIWQRRIGAKRGRWLHHGETKRFSGYPELLVMRHWFIMREGERRGVALESPMTFGVMTSDLYVHEFSPRFTEPWQELCIEAGGSWYGTIALTGWPPSYGLHYWSPWKRDQMSKEQYLDVLGPRWNGSYHSGQRPSPDPHDIRHCSTRWNAGVGFGQIIEGVIWSASNTHEFVLPDYQALPKGTP